MRIVKDKPVVKRKVKTAARAVVKMKTADEIKAIGGADLAASEKQALIDKHVKDGKPVKELDDIESGIEQWLSDNGWVERIEQEAFKGFWTFTITSAQSVNPYAQGQIAAGYLRGLGFKCVVVEGREGVVLVDVVGGG